MKLRDLKQIIPVPHHGRHSKGTTCVVSKNTSSTDFEFMEGGRPGRCASGWIPDTIEYSRKYALRKIGDQSF